VLIGTKGASARGTVATLFNVTEDLDVASTDFVKVGTGWVITPLPREFHDVSPLYTQIIRQMASHGLRVYSEAFTAYVYSTPWCTRASRSCRSVQTPHTGHAPMWYAVRCRALWLSWAFSSMARGFR